MLNLKFSGIYTIKCENDNNPKIKFKNQGQKGKLKNKDPKGIRQEVYMEK